MTTVMMDVAEIRFTQEHVYDSFNANSAKAGGMVELMEEILAGTKTPADLPLIRVARKRGAYWCVDNRRLFTYKHCQLGEIPVQVFDWKDMREFELKWRNGLTTRQKTSEGRRAGLKQRTDTPFPKSVVAEPSLSDIDTYMSQRQQQQHDAKIASLRKRREKRLAAEAAANDAGTDTAASLKCLLVTSANKAAPEIVAEGHQTNRKKGKREAVSLGNHTSGNDSADGVTSNATNDAVCASKARKLKKRRKNSAASVARGKEASLKSNRGQLGAVTTTSGGSVKLTVDVAKDNSSDEAYDVEVTAM